MRGGGDLAEEFNTDGMVDMYLFENGQLLEQLEAITLEQKDSDGFDEVAINEFFRAMHTIKGSSAMMEFTNISALAHSVEDVFFILRENPGRLASELRPRFRLLLRLLLT